MIGSQTTRPPCSHLKLDHVATPACPFVLVSVALYASVYACVSLWAQTDRPPTDRGNATSWGGKWTTGRGRVNDPCQNNWLPCRTQWWRHTSSDRLKMIPTLWRCRCSFGDAGLFKHRVWTALNRQLIVLCHIWTVSRTRVSLCKSVTTLTASVLIPNDNASCHHRRARTVMGAL